MTATPAIPIPPAVALTHLDAGGDETAEPLIVMHGLFGSARNWSMLSKRFAAKRRVFALDLRNHGGSPWSDEMTYPAMAADIIRFLDDQGLDKAALLGHSMGGKAAMAAALLAPDRVSHLIVADIAPVTYTHTHAPFVAAMKGADLDGVSRRGEVDAQLADAVPVAPLRSFLMQNLEQTDGGFRWRINLDAVGHAMGTLIGFPDFGGATYDGPTLFVGGGNSDYVTPEHEPVIRRYFPKAVIETLPGAGHWLHAEQPDNFAHTIERVL